MRRLALVVSGVLVASALAVSPLLASPASAAELLQDGGFEATTGSPPNSPAWTEADSRFNSPLCIPTYCNNQNGASVPRTGIAWVRFGGDSDDDHVARISQSVVIPVGTATLTYWYRNSTVSWPYTATLLVKVDGTTVRTHTEVSNAEGSYSRQTVSLSSYADGASHTLAFEYANNFFGLNRMLIDDVSLDHTPPAVATPTVSATVPGSPATSTTPRVRGSAESGATVTLYADSGCTSAPLGTGSADEFADPGITATVPADATTTIWARARIGGRPDSACSTTSVAYTSDSTGPALVEFTGTSPASPSQSLTPTVLGTAEAGSTVALYPTADCSGTPAATGSAATFASPGLAVTVSADSTTTYWARATDGVGNPSGCSTSSVIYVNDRTAPGQVVLESITPASPNSSTTPVVRGTAEDGAVVRIYSTADCSGTARASGLAADLAGAGITVPVPADTTTTLWAQATDAADNISACSTTSLTYTNDSSAPNSPTLTSLTPSSPSSSTTTTVRGTADVLTTVSLYSTTDCGGTPLATGAAAVFGLTGISVTVPANSTTTFRARATDLAGNPSACSTSSLTYVNDITDPALVELTSLTPASPSPNLTPTVKGTAEAGSRVDLYTSATCTGVPVATGTADAFASSGFTVSVSPSSATTFRATATDAAGNTAACSTSSLTYVHDSTAPEAVVVSAVAPDSPSQSLTPVVYGSAEDGSRVRVYTTPDCSGSPAAAGPAATFATAGIQVTVSADSTTTFRASARDAAGNVSTCSASSVDYVNDRTKPNQAVVTGVSPTSPNTTTNPLVTGTAEDGSTVTLYGVDDCSGPALGSGLASAFAAPGVRATVALGSTTQFYATATDAAGNVSECSDTSIGYTSDLLDGGFEAAVGDPPNSPFWNEFDTPPFTPLCIAGQPPCGPADAETGPRTGTNYAWFGGITNSVQRSGVSQVVRFPDAGPVVLTFWYKNSTVSLPYDAELSVVVDGQSVKTIRESSVQDADYLRFVVDLARFADGGNHTLGLIYDSGTPTGVSNMLVDDLSLGVSAAGARVATPTVNPLTAPASPATSATPLVSGTAEDGSRVRLYGNPTCTGAPLGGGPAADFAAGGIKATLTVGAAYTIYAQADKPGFDNSLCSTTSATYRVLGPPDTAFTKVPKKRVKTKKPKAKVAFAFTSPTAGATFECNLDGKGWKPCVSGAKVKLKKGKHTFAVRAVANGLVDATPAVTTVKVKRKRPTQR